MPALARISGYAAIFGYDDALFSFARYLASERRVPGVFCDKKQLIQKIVMLLVAGQQQQCVWDAQGKDSKFP